MTGLIDYTKLSSSGKATKHWKFKFLIKDNLRKEKKTKFPLFSF